MKQVPLRVGHKVWVEDLPGIRHYGIFVGLHGPKGEDMVHNGDGKVVLESTALFCKGHRMYFGGCAKPGHERAVAEKALSFLGTKLDLSNFCCEHFLTPEEEDVIPVIIAG